ncbi:MAG: hypothetical protein QM778_19960 [Myxococcales bacterium]
MSSAPNKTARLAIALCLIAGAFVVTKSLGLEHYFETAQLRQMVSHAGPWGPLAFVMVFVGAVVSQVPGLVFVFAAPALFHLPEAWVLCFLASNIAVILNFALVRRLGGQPLASIQQPWLRKLFGALDAHPIRTVAILRTITVMFPPVTGALALTRISAREHAVGSAIGMVLPLTAILVAAGLLLS